jgi:hypothetical protein
VFPLLQDNPSQLVSRGEQYCPRVEVLPRELYVPNNVPQELSLTLTNLPPDLLAAAAPAPPQFLCQVPVRQYVFTGTRLYLHSHIKLCLYLFLKYARTVMTNVK